RGVERVAAVAVEQDVGDGAEEEVVALLLLVRQDAVQPAHGVRRIGDGQDEVRERLYVGRRELRLVAQQTGEGHLELPEGGVLVERVAARIVAARAVAAPVHRAVVRHAAQALGGHRTLQRVEGRVGRLDLEGERIRDDDVVGVPEVPRQAVEVAEDVAARARGLAVAGRQPGVVEAGPPVQDGRGLRRVDRQVRDLLRRRELHHRDGVVEAGEDVGPVVRVVEHDAGGAATAEGDVRGGAGYEGVALQLARADYAERARAERRDVERRADGGARHAERRREAALLHAGGRGPLRVVDVLVQVTREDVRPIEYRDPGLVQMTLDGGATEGESGTFEAHLVPRIGVAD